MRKIRTLTLSMVMLVLFALMIGGCANVTVNIKTADKNKSGVDYSDKGNWAYFGEGEGKDADLFLIAPTVDVQDEYNMSMDDEKTKANFLEHSTWSAAYMRTVQGCLHRTTARAR